MLPDLLHSNETRVWGDQAYRGQRAVIRQHAPKARDFINRRYRHRGIVNAVKLAKNRTKSKVRAKVEHPIGIIKRVFGFAKVRYRGLKKNTHRLLVTCALANLFMVRRHLLRCAVACASRPATRQAPPLPSCSARPGRLRAIASSDPLQVFFSRECAAL